MLTHAARVRPAPGPGGPAPAARRHVLRVDLPGCGESPPTPSYDVPRQAGRLAALRDDLGLRSVTVASHSSGGYVATALAERRPDLVGALALVSTGPGLDALLTQPVALRLLRAPPFGPLLRPRRTDAMLRGAIASTASGPVDVPDERIDDVRGIPYGSSRPTTSRGRGRLRRGPCPQGVRGGRTASNGSARPGVESWTDGIHGCPLTRTRTEQTSSEGGTPCPRSDAGRRRHAATTPPTTDDGPSPRAPARYVPPASAEPGGRARRHGAGRPRPSRAATRGGRHGRASRPFSAVRDSDSETPSAARRPARGGEFGAQELGEPLGLRGVGEDRPDPGPPHGPGERARVGRAGGRRASRGPGAHRLGTGRGPGRCRTRGRLIGRWCPGGFGPPEHLATRRPGTHTPEMTP